MFLVLIAIFTIIFLSFSQLVQAWYKDNISSYEYTESGDMLPPRGIYMGTYYTGAINVLQGEEWNQLVIEAEAYSMTPNREKSDAPAYLFCLFLKDEPLGGKYNSLEEWKEIIVRTSKDEFCRHIEGKAKIKITVPEETNYVQVSLWSNRTSSVDVGYLEKAICDIYGYAMDGNQYAYFYLRK